MRWYLVLTLAMFACSGSDGADGVNGADGADGADAIDGQDGVNGQDGADGSDGQDVTVLGPPTLDGHTNDQSLVIPYTVQAAFNDDTFFWRLTYRGNEGVRHQYWHYTNGAWQREGAPRRDAQASIDNDPDQGDVSTQTTIYEQRTTIMVNDPYALESVDDFEKFGCYLTCHDTARNMPRWDSSKGHDSKTVPLAYTAAPSGTPVLDLWHWRAGRSGPIGLSDDQNVLAMDFADTSTGDDGGRRGDGGTGPFTSNSDGDSDGNPDFVMDPSTTFGRFAFPWDDLWSTGLYYMTNPDAQNLGPTSPNPVIMTYADAVAAGYTPQEGDTVPYRILRQSAGSRGDITSYGTTFTPTEATAGPPTSADETLGVWKVQLQRALDTGNSDDVAFLPGNVYDVSFAVHLWQYTARDHYISLPATLGVGTPADIEAISVPGAGATSIPNFDDLTQFPPVTLYLYQPGIATWEFLSGATASSGDQFLDPATGANVNQVHGGSSAVSSGSLACADCHVVRISDGPNALEELAPRRGGIFDNTPIVQ